ncbi:MAG: hypothetical protein HC897_00680, partial [Thermoanaerobaculia bacterium]|nr:hypothetical protein [Thermoanaerobaculia bacterium]
MVAQHPARIRQVNPCEGVEIVGAWRVDLDEPGGTQQLLHPAQLLFGPVRIAQRQ